LRPSESHPAIAILISFCTSNERPLAIRRTSAAVSTCDKSDRVKSSIGDAFRAICVGGVWVGSILGLEDIYLSLFGIAP
jgi:hypothetical protein